MNEEKTSLYFWKLCPLQHIFGAFTITFIACTFSDVKPKSQGDQFLISHVCQQLFFFLIIVSVFCVFVFFWTTSLLYFKICYHFKKINQQDKLMNRDIWIFTVGSGRRKLRRVLPEMVENMEELFLAENEAILKLGFKNSCRSYFDL